MQDNALVAPAPTNAREYPRFLAILFAAILVAALFLRIGNALLSHSIVHPDEIFQSEEPAHHLVYGYGVVTWEWRLGIRSWVFPAFLALIMKATGWMSTGSVGYRVGIALVLSVISLSTVWFGFTWARRVAGAGAAVLAAGACAFWYELIIFAPRALTEVVAAHVLLPGLYLGVYGNARSERSRLFLAGFLCGLAAALRIQLGPAVIFAVVYFCWGNWRQTIVPVMCGVCLPLLVFGVVDAFTWSYPFHSFVTYFWVNVVEARSAAFGVKPWYWYCIEEVKHCGPVLVLALFGLRRSSFLGWIVLIVLFSHSIISHKEDRFLYPVIPLIITLAAIGIVEIAGGNEADGTQFPRTTVVIGLVLFAITSVLLRSNITYWQQKSGSMLIFDQLSKDHTACGVGLAGFNSFDTGGYTHLHRRIPIMVLPDNWFIDEDSTSFNTLLMARQTPPPSSVFRLDVCRDDVCVYRRTGKCTASMDDEINKVLEFTGN